MNGRLQLISREFTGSIISVCLIVLGSCLFFPTPLLSVVPPELRWLIIGAGLGTLLSDIVARADRQRAEVRHRESLRVVLGTLSGTPRQALRLGTALADMLADATCPKVDERRYLLANARVLGVETALHAFIDKPERSQSDVEDFVLLVRGHRGIEAAEGLKLGFQLEMMAKEIHTGVGSPQELRERADFLMELHATAMRHFALHARFDAWIAANLKLHEILPSNRVAAIRQTLKMLWQSRHLRTEAGDCDCEAVPCAKRKRYANDIEGFRDGLSTKFPTLFELSLSEYEQERRAEDFRALWPFSKPEPAEAVK